MLKFDQWFKTDDSATGAYLQIEAAPHDWLSPRVTVVVHHGGAGTTAASLRASQPTIICPFIADQPFWDKVVYEAEGGRSHYHDDS